MPKSVSIRNDDAYSAREHVEGLLQEHYDEVAKNKDLMVLDPDWDKYFVLEEAGKLITVLAFEGSTCVGYCVSLLDTHLHYKGLLHSLNDVIFLHRDHRASSLGLRLIKQTEDEARARGAQLMLWHAKEGSALSKIMQAKRRPVQDIVYSHEL